MHQQQRVALVAGGGRGIGYAICERLSNDGFIVVAAARTIDELDRLKQALKKNNRAVSCYEFDIADPASVDKLIKQVMNEYGRIDVMVNSAGTSYVAPVALSKYDKCQEVIQVNLMGAFILSRAVVRVMIRQKSGRIVHIGSISGTIGAAYNAIYAATKAGVAGLVKSLALEVASVGITVNAVQPGTVHTELFEQTHGARAKLKGITLDEQKKEMEDDSPLNRLVDTKEIASAVAYLVSDDAAAVTGHLLNVDGGRSVS